MKQNSLPRQKLKRGLRNGYTRAGDVQAAEQKFNGEERTE